MRQFDRFVQRTLRPPNVVLRISSLVLSIALTARAVVHPTLENVLSAAWFVILLGPDVVAPGRYRAWLAGLERRHPVLGGTFGALIMSCATFLLLRFFLDRPLSAVIALALALIAVTASLLGRRRRTT
ncbi:hypothetical protein OG474_18540 [Kribbella sp. NBC_01505]|uniref:hypothetical protein n=1 Tax=Kribbella sp. NBC_01505 TaxID=2903580 RepID=UPI003865AC56